MSLIATIDARDKGAFQVSIGTSLALEALNGEYPDRPESPAPINSGVREVWFNLRTIIRNLLGALPTEIKDSIIPDVLIPALVEEVTIIDGVINKISAGMVRTVFYACDYVSVPRKFPKAQIRQLKTPKQISQHQVEEQALQMFLQNTPSVDIRLFSFEITGQHPYSYIVTHLPIDLLSRYSFQKLELLESHSGRIKSPSQWYTKLSNGKELEFIPFNRFSLQLFGDSNNLFAMMPAKLRHQVVELAKEDRWTSLTTDEKIRMSLRKVPDPLDRSTLLALL